MKITNSEIQLNDYAAMSFYDAMNHNVKSIRECIHLYRKMRKVNTSIFGYIKALALLSEYSNSFDIPIIKQEAKEWEEILLKYTERIEKKIPENICDDFKKDVTESLTKIVLRGNDYPEWQWKQDSLEREIRVRVKNQELKDKYELLIKNKEEYKDRLGNALHNYINDCLKKLDLENKNDTVIKIDKEDVIIKSFNPTFFKSKPNEYTYLISDFSIFSNDEINAYDIEDKIKKQIKKTDLELLKKLKFDCECSLFSVQSKNIEDLNKLNRYLLDIIKTVVNKV